MLSSSKLSRSRRIDDVLAGPVDGLDMPRSARLMIQAMAPFALTEPRESRHDFQNAVVEWVADILEAKERELQRHLEVPIQTADEAAAALSKAVRYRLDIEAKRRRIQAEAELDVEADGSSEGAAPAGPKVPAPAPEMDEVNAELAEAKLTEKEWRKKLQTSEHEAEQVTQILRAFRDGALMDFDCLSQAALRINEHTRSRAPHGRSAMDFGWIRRENTAAKRRARRDVAYATRRAVRCHGYRIGHGADVALARVSNMISGTFVVSPTAGHWPYDLPQPHAEHPGVEVSVVRESIVEVAIGLVNEGHRVAVVSAASAYHLGGGFSTGGRHALEEAMCVQTTLHASLEKAAALAPNGWEPSAAEPPQRPDGKSWHMHIPEDGVILSPSVDIFRGGTAEGYPFLHKVCALDAVISVAMPNCNERVSDAPVDALADEESYREQLVQKWRAVLVAATSFTTATCLVVPDAGCGVFRNPPAEVGAALGSLLKDEFYTTLRKVVIAFPGGNAGEDFAQAVRQALG